MEREFKEKSWSVRIPDGWLVRRDPECATFVAELEIGALQISAAFKESEVSDADLREFAEEHLASGAPTRPVEMGDFVGFKIAFGTEDAFWRHWYLRHGKQVLFVTYNCAATERGVEDAMVEMILTTLSASNRDAA